MNNQTVNPIYRENVEQFFSSFKMLQRAGLATALFLIAFLLTIGLVWEIKDRS